MKSSYRATYSQDGTTHELSGMSDGPEKIASVFQELRSTPGVTDVLMMTTTPVMKNGAIEPELEG